MSSQPIYDNPISYFSEEVESLKKNSGWLLGLGILMIILGIVSVGFPFLFGIALELLIAVLLVTAGLGHLAYAFKARGIKGTMVQVLIGILYTGAAGALIFFPAAGVAAFSLVLMGVFFAEGIFKIIFSFQLKPVNGWGWVLVSGLIALGMAGILWYGLPHSALWALGLMFGIHLLVWGVWLVSIALATQEVT